MSGKGDAKSFSNVRSGDVLVSHPTAMREHAISIVPNAPHARYATHDAAVSEGRSQAGALGVDAWLTEDHTHVVKIVSNRTPDELEPVAAVQRDREIERLQSEVRRDPVG
jgi:hypothetical protein